MTQRTDIFGAVFVLVVLAGCSMADESTGRYESGTGGGGGATSAVSTGTGGAGQGGNGGSQSTSGDAGFPFACDEADSCGDYSRGCTGCAVEGTCAGPYKECFGDGSCLEFNMCMAGCKSDVPCQDACASKNPLGAERFNALVTCVVCQACPMACADIASICPD
jgi:hypothetical protein